MTSPIDTARAAWGEDLPEWVLRLAEECQATSQNKVAVRIGRSGALVSQVLRRRYSGDMSGVEELVAGHLMQRTVQCPALGALPAHECQDWRRKSRKFSGANSLRVRMFRACKRCPINASGGAAAANDGESND